MGTQTKLKWGKNSYTVSISRGMSASTYKNQVQHLTGLPTERQKLLCPKIWKGPLKDTDNISELILACKDPTNVVVTLIGSAEVLQEKSLDDRPRFLEDMSPDDIKRMEMSQYQDDDQDEINIVDIVALQKEPGVERHDGKVGTYQYNRFVTGLPQHQVNSMLTKRKNASKVNNMYEDESELEDVLAMTMGMELRRAFVNSLAVLASGTIVSGLDDGHVQLWSRCQMIKDLKHAGGCVDHVLTFPASTPDDPAFITAGGGAICIWTEDGRRIIDLGSFPGTTPGSIAVGVVGGNGSLKYLASCFRITRQVDPNQFRLVPQNEEECRRRAEAEMQEQLIQNELLRASKCVKVWFYDSNQTVASQVREAIVECNSPVTQLKDMNRDLICADEDSCITQYTWRLQEHDQTIVSPQDASRLQLTGYQYRIALLQTISDSILAVSINPVSNEHPVVSSATLLRIPIARGVLLIDMQTKTIKAALNAHKDVVQCICPLPNGSILTAGGKMDAKVCLWKSSDITNALSGDEATTLTEAKEMKEPGYVFDLQVVPDSDPTSNVFAIAGARYNTIKIVI